MTDFRYVAAGPDGVRQSGTITASNLVSARYELVGRHLSVQSLKERKAFNEIELIKKKVKAQDIANLSRQLSAFLRAGIPVLDAIETIAEESDKEMRALLGTLASSLRAGEPFSEAIAGLHESFPSYYPGIIRSAELSGRLDVVLEQLATYMERDLATRGKIKSALMYPAVLLTMTVVVVVVLVGFVLPKFKTFFKGFGAKLPLTTRILLRMGDLFTSYWWLIALLLIGAAAVIVPYVRSARGKYARDRLMLRIPVVREVVRASVVERFCRILAAMVQAGVPIADAMNAAIDSTDNRVFVEHLIPASERMLRGEGLARPLGETGLFPPMVVQMMRVGEETGTLDQQLEISADYYKSQLETKLERLTALFEPMMIVIMGVVVGFVAVALVSAMYGIYNQTGAKWHRERGDTLLEVLVAVMVMGIAFVAILSGLGSAINLSGRQRGQANADVVLVSAADTVKSQTYVACPSATTASYTPTTGVTLPPGWATANVTVSAIKFRNGAVWSTTCPTTDQNVQLVTVTARTPNGLSSESVDVVKRKPS